MSEQDITSEQQTPERPPTNGPGSGATAWREYAAAVTSSPLESWAGRSREEIIAQLGQPDGLAESEREADRNAAAARGEPVDGAVDAGEQDTLPKGPAPADRGRSGRAQWMVPTTEGWTPEPEKRDVPAPAPARQPTSGRLVRYRLTETDVERIAARRDGDGVTGNSVDAGDEFPMLVVRVWPEGRVNGQVFLDGPDTQWVTSVDEGEGPGTWSWPERA